MSETTFAGRARVFGDDVNTDYIISSRRKRDSVDPAALSRYLMEDIRPGFGPTVEPGDILVGDRNFGCGSAMEIAPLVIVASGIRVILAKSFARTFYRNGVNCGLILVEMDTEGVAEMDLLEVHLGGETVTQAEGVLVRDTRQGWSRPGRGPQGILKDIVDGGGLLRYIALHGGLPGSSLGSLARNQHSSE